MTLSGWGYTGENKGLAATLMKADQKIVVTDASALHEDGFTWIKLNPDRHLQGSQLTGTGSCHGDSGGK